LPRRFYWNTIVMYSGKCYPDYDTCKNKQHKQSLQCSILTEDVAWWYKLKDEFKNPFIGALVPCMPKAINKNKPTLS
jgi:hypothetical protein